jgi:flagellar biosynthetic protein FliQ
MPEDPSGMAARGALLLMLQIGGLPLLVMLGVGLVVSIVQAVTQIQEATLAFLPKLAALALVLLLFGGVMAQLLVRYGESMFDQATAIGGLP